MQREDCRSDCEESIDRKDESLEVMKSESFSEDMKQELASSSATTHCGVYVGITTSALECCSFYFNFELPLPPLLIISIDDLAKSCPDKAVSSTIIFPFRPSMRSDVSELKLLGYQTYSPIAFLSCSVAWGLRVMSLQLVIE